MTRKTIFLLCALLTVALLIGAASASHITIGNVNVNSGSTTTADVILDSVDVDDGLAGYQFDINIANPSVARVTAVSYPSALQGSTNTATLPFTSGFISWVDNNEQIQPGSPATNIVLATLTIEGLSSGTTTLGTSFNGMDGDGPNFADLTLDSTIDNPTITVSGPPTADFAASKTNPNVGETITFTDSSSGSPTSWAWDFNNDAVVDSTAQNPTYAYTAAGTYTVKLTATNGVGSDDVIKTDYITVSSVPAPVAAFSTAAINGLAPVSATFTDASTNTPTSWNWEYRIADNGAWTSFSTTQNPSFTATTAGTYDIRLTATNAGGSNTLTKTHVFAAAIVREPLATVQSGTVSGDLYVSSPTVYPATETTQTFTLPAAAVGNVQWARLYVNTYAGSVSSGYGLISTVQVNGNTIATETLNIGSETNGHSYPVNNHVNKVYSDYEAQYDVTSLITSASPVVHVTSSALPGYSFDGRIKGVTLVVAYNDGDTDVVRYWVNHGGDWSSPGSGSTVFDTTGIASGWSSAESSIRYHSSTDAATYTFNSVPESRTATTPNTGGAMNIWDVKDELVAGTNTVAYTTASGSYKTTIATLKVKYVTPPTITSFVSSKNPAGVGETVTFTGVTTGATSYDVNFGDGSAHATGTGPWTHSYSTAGTYPVVLTATNEGGSVTASVTGGQVITDKPIITITPTPQTVNPSETATFVITMDSAPAGLAGYDMVVSLSNGAAADITSVTYDTNWAQMPLNPTVPADSVRIGAVDTQQKIYPGGPTGPYTLATITVKGVAAGSTNIAMTIGHMDDDSGNAIDPNANAVGVLNIGTYTGPTASFTGTPTTGNAPLTVAFDSSTSSGTITTYQWDFDNDGTIDSTAANPSATYSTIGTYSVKLTVSGPGGSNTLLRNAYITVGDGTAPTVTIVADHLTGNYPLPVAFSATTTGNVQSYAWNFGDGVFSTLAAPTHTYTYPGTFTASLTVTGTGGSATDTETIVVTQNAPVAGIVANPTSGTSPLLVQFTDASTGNFATYDWDFGDGSAHDTTANPSHTYTSAGVYTVTHFVTGPGGESNHATTTITVTGLSVNFVASETTGVASAEHGFTTTFTSTVTPSGATPTYLWDFGDGSTSTEANPSHTYYGHLKSFTVTLTVHNGADVASVTRTNYISITPYLEAFPKYDTAGTITGYYSQIPADLNGDYVYEDINHNGRVDYDDVVAFYGAWTWNWFTTNTDVDNAYDYDYSGNGALGTQDVVVLNDMVLY